MSWCKLLVFKRIISRAYNYHDKIQKRVDTMTEQLQKNRDIHA